MGKGLKVLMMGGQRCGKSSALAAIIDAFMKPPINALLQARDTTVLDKSGQEKQETITAKLAEIKDTLVKHQGRTILVNSGKTSKIWHYKVALSIPDNMNEMEILFTDVNGEFYESGNMHDDEVSALIENYDVFVIAVDTPFLMEAFNDNNEYVDSIINEKYNFVDDIHNFLTSINLRNNQEAKLVIFTPIKCEAWIQTGRAEEVVQRTKEVYATAIAGLEKHSNIRIEFLPVQTVGNMVFQEHLPASVFSWSKSFLLFFSRQVSMKGSLLINGNVRLSDGTEMSPSIGMLADDMDSVLIPDTDIVRPNSWFLVKSTEYAPKNCEQLALHILEFMLRKVIDARIREEKNRGFFERGARAAFNILLNASTLGLWSKLKDYFGNIPLEKMTEIIGTMQSQQIIKYNGEGIEIYKDVELLKQQ